MKAQRERARVKLLHRRHTDKAYRDKENARHRAYRLKCKLAGIPRSGKPGSAQAARRRRERLADCYVRRLLVEHSNLQPSDIPPVLLDLKRAQVQLIREKNTYEKHQSNA